MGNIVDKKAKSALKNLLLRQDYLVTQANELARSFGNLTVLEHRVLDYCFSYVRKEDTVATIYKLTLNEITKHLGLNKSGENYSRVAVALKSLNKKTPIYIQQTEPNGLQSILMTHLFSRMKLVSDGTFEFKFSEDVAPYVFELKEKYYYFKLSELSRVKSKYTLIMLKLWNANVKKWHDFNNPNSLPPNLHLTGSLEDWQSWFLGYDYDSDDEKPIKWAAGRFKQKVLKVALGEIAELYPKSNIVLESLRKGRRVVGYDLTITQINSTLMDNNVYINGEKQEPRPKGKQGVIKDDSPPIEQHQDFIEKTTIVKNDTTAYEEIERLRKELAKLKQKNADLEEKISTDEPSVVENTPEHLDILDEIAPTLKNGNAKSNNWQQTDLFGDM